MIRCYQRFPGEKIISSFTPPLLPSNNNHNDDDNILPFYAEPESRVILKVYVNRSTSRTCNATVTFLHLACPFSNCDRRETHAM